MPRLPLYATLATRLHPESAPMLHSPLIVRHSRLFRSKAFDFHPSKPTRPDVPNMLYRNPYTPLASHPDIYYQLRPQHPNMRLQFPLSHAGQFDPLLAHIPTHPHRRKRRALYCLPLLRLPTPQTQANKLVFSWLFLVFFPQVVCHRMHVTERTAQDSAVLPRHIFIVCRPVVGNGFRAKLNRYMMRQP